MTIRNDALSEALKHISPATYPMLSTDLCVSQVPESAGMSDEVNDMVYFFCGADCYEQWHNPPQEKLTPLNKR